MTAATVSVRHEPAVSLSDQAAAAEALATRSAELEAAMLHLKSMYPAFETAAPPGDEAEEAPLDIYSGTDLAVLAGEQPGAILEPILPAGGLMLVHGPRGIGLSHVMLNLAAALTGGGTLLGWAAPRPVHVLALMGTLSPQVCAQRLQAALAAVGGVEPGERLRLVAPESDGRLAPAIDDSDGQDMLAPSIDECDVVLIDDLAQLAPRTRRDWPAGRVCLRRWLLGLRRAGRTVLIGQHSGGNLAASADARALECVDQLADVVLGLRPCADAGASDGLRFELHVERSVHSSGLVRRPREVRLLQDEAGRSRWATFDLETTRKERFQALVAEGIPMKVAMQHAGASRASAYRWARELQPSARRTTHDREEFGTGAASLRLASSNHPMSEPQARGPSSDSRCGT